MENYLTRLKAAGYKLTPRRKAIIEIFRECDSHLTPEEVWEKLKEKFDRCGLPGVYRNLESLVDCGVLARVQQFDRKKHYGLCTAEQGSHHHHITCIRCGKVEDIPNCAIQGIKNLKGYRVVSHFMQVNGICTSCLKGPGG
jgi:Fe2+ or Zn2+ uptake regulation protein